MEYGVAEAGIDLGVERGTERAIGLHVGRLGVPVDRDRDLAWSV